MSTARGQAVIEMAMVIPLMLAIIFGFLGVLLWIETFHDLRAATALASTTAATFRDDSAEARAAETETFDGTMRQYSYVQVRSFGCVHDPITYRVSCRASAMLRFDRTPLAVAWPGNPGFDSVAVSYFSRFRSR
ncbi:MAG: TadE family protein [Candidatus Dormibacteria bacterium]